MKKFVILCLFFASLQAKAEVITSKQLEDYSKVGRYLDCMYASGNNCVGAISTEDARKKLISYKKMEAFGLNASKKAQLDAAVESLLLKITQEDVNKFIAEIKDKEPLDLLENYYIAGAKTKTVVSMPGEDALYALDQNDFSQKGLENDVESLELVHTREEMIELLGNVPEDDEYVVKPGYFSQLKNNKEPTESRSIDLLEDSTLAVVKVNKEIESNIEKSKKTFENSTFLRRFASHGYDIMIESAVVKTAKVIDANLPEPVKNNIIIDTKGGLSDLSMDEKWIYRYKSLDEENYKEREKDSSYLMLEFIADELDKKYENAKQEKDIDLKNSLKEKADKHYQDGMQYYQTLQKYQSDDKVKKLLIRYQSLNRSVY